MTKIKNEGTKIVHIGTKTLLPGDEIIVSDKVADTPAIKVLVQHKNLTVSEAVETAAETATAAESVEKADTATETVEAVAEETETKKSTRKSTKKADTATE